MMAVGVIAVAALGLGAQSQTVPSFGTSVEAVYLDVFVSRGGHNLEGLTSDNFEVSDDGVVQSAEIVSSAAVPLHTVLVLDTSTSVAGAAFDHLKAAAQAFLDGLGPNDRVSLLTFAYGVRLAGELAAPANRASASLAEATARGTTALHDAVFTALKTADPRHGRPVIVVFSDGVDRLSFLSAEQVLRVARESDATVFVVFLATDLLRRDGTPVKRAKRAPDFLRSVAAETGGVLWQAMAADELRGKFLEILEQVKNRYVLRFEPTGVSGTGWREIKVRLKGARGKLRARRGYFRAGNRTR